MVIAVDCAVHAADNGVSAHIDEADNVGVKLNLGARHLQVHGTHRVQVAQCVDTTVAAGGEDAIVDVKQATDHKLGGHSR